MTLLLYHNLLPIKFNRPNTSQTRIRHFVFLQEERNKAAKILHQHHQPLFLLKSCVHQYQFQWHQILSLLIAQVYSSSERIDIRALFLLFRRKNVKNAWWKRLTGMALDTGM